MCEYIIIIIILYYKYIIVSHGHYGIASISLALSHPLRTAPILLLSNSSRF